MRRLSRAATTLLVPLILTACGGSQPAGQSAQEPVTVGVAKDAGPVVADVDGIQVTAREFEIAAARKVPANGKSLSATEKKEVLDDLVTQKMLYLEAKKAGIDQDPKVQKVMVNTLLRQEVYANVRNSDFTEEELRQYFDAHKDDFVVPAKVQVRRIYIKAKPARTDAEAQTLAEKYDEQVKASPDSFRQVASEHSEDPYRRRGGDIGYVSEDGKPGIPPQVIKQAFALKVGQVSEPFAAGGGWNVVMVSGKRDRVERTFEQMKGSVLRKVKNDRYKELYADYVAGIKDKFNVQIDQKVLDGLEVKPGRRLPFASNMEPIDEQAAGGQ